MKEPKQQSLSRDDKADELRAYTDRNLQLYYDYANSLDNEARADLKERSVTNQEVYSIYLQAWNRTGTHYYHDAPVFTMSDLDDANEMEVSGSPLELLAEIAKRLSIVADAGEAEVASSTTTVPPHMFADSTSVKPDGKLWMALHEDDTTIEGNRHLTLVAKEQVLEELKAHEQLVGNNKSTLHEVMQSLTTIYLHTMLTGKKALHYKVADAIGNAWMKPIDKELKQMTEQQYDVLSELVNLIVIPVQTEENIQRIHEMAAHNPQLKEVALMWVMTDYFREALRGQAKQNELLADMAQRTRRLLHYVSQNSIYTPEEEARTSELFCEEAGIDYVRRTVPVETIAVEETTSSYDLKPMELDWEVLPPGETELEKGARQIIEDTAVRSGRSAEIDLNRLNILEGIRELWGKDRSYYSRGVRKKRSVVHDTDGHEQPDEYIILVLQEPDTATGLVRESVVAESPIAGPNALYIYRPDTTDHRHDWRTVMSLPKDRSRLLGARDVKHTTSKQAANLNDTMIEKAFHLLTAEPSEFLELQFNGVDKAGNVRIRRTLGRGAGHLTQQ